MTWTRLTSVLLCLGISQMACASEKAKPLRAEIGVFFGGQMQRAERVIVSRVHRPTIGFRVHLPTGESGRGSNAYGKIDFEIVRPGPAGRRVTQQGSLEVPEGQGALDHVIELPAEAKMGIWNVRVLHQRTILADRAMFLARPAR